jgi:gliding motility-associated-like protein
MLHLRTFLCLTLLVPVLATAQEICNNGLDDDNNGLIDLNDPACTCSAVILPPNVQSYIPNHSFEEQEPGPNGPCCPFGFVSPFSYPWLTCAVGWQQATSATSDYYHMCGFAPPSFPLPPPDGLGAVGFISTIGYMEYVGRHIFDNPLHVGTEYTLSLWTAGLSISNTNYLGNVGNIGVFYEGIYPLTLWGRTNVVPMPIGTLDCIGYEPGWVELGRVNFQPDNDWLHVSMTFTPPQEIKQIMIGAPCDLPATYAPINYVIDSLGYIIPMDFLPYTLVDDLMLTQAVDQVLTPVTSTGRVCDGNVVVTATPPVGATSHQWYRDGVAILGQTATTLNVSALGLGGGLYTMTSDYMGQCLMGNTSVWTPRIPPMGLSASPRSGCAPLDVAFEDTTGGTTSTGSWSFGDGATSTASSGRHTYTEPGTYPVTLTIRSIEGCLRDTSVTVEVTGYLDGVITANPNPTDVEHTTVALSGSSSTGDIVSWWWDLGAATPATASVRDVPATFPAEAGDYPVLLAVTSSTGCVDTVRSVVHVYDRGSITMPNVFSPNADGHNDRFIPLDYVGEPGLLEIYNRWGQMVFSTRSLAQGWNGGDVPDGTYYFLVTPDNKLVEKQTGHVTLVR